MCSEDGLGNDGNLYDVVNGIRNSKRQDLQGNVKMSLRICVTVFRQIIELTNDGKVDGFVAPILIPLLEDITTLFPNTTISPSDKLGNMNQHTMMFDGCLGRLQRNESDFQIPFIPFPIVAPGLQQGFMALTSTTTICSAYNRTATTSKTDVMDAFQSFSRPLWSLTAFTTTVITLVVFLVFRHGLLRGRKSKATNEHRTRKAKLAKLSMDRAAQVLIGNLFKQHSSYKHNNRKQSAKTVLFVFALFSVMIVVHFASMIKTEMVVQKRPQTISSYKEILQTLDVKPLWARQLNDHWDFMHADPMSEEGQIWLRARKKGLDSCFIETDADIKREFPSVLTRQAVWFGPSYLLRPLTTNICAFMRAAGQFDSYNVWTNSDPSASEKLNGMLLSSAMHANDVRKFNRFLQALFEHNIILQSIRKLEFSYVPDIGSQSVHDCLANRIIYPDYELTSVNTQHYDRLFLISGCSLLLSALFLFIEHMRQLLVEK